MILLDIRVIEVFFHNSWEDRISFACFSGYLDSIKTMESIIDNEDNLYQIWNKGLLNACAGGKLDVVEFTIKKGANKISSEPRIVQP